MRIKASLQKAVVLLTCVAVFYGTGPENILRLSPLPDLAYAKRGPGGGGFSGRGGSRPSGARAGGGNRAATRPARQPSGTTRQARPPAASQPTTRPSGVDTQPARAPGAGAVTRPEQPSASLPANRPAGDRPVGDRPAGDRPAGDRPDRTRPPGERPPGARPPGDRPAGARPPGTRPPGARPPGTRPPVAGRPPGWNPPNHRPPGYRPPYYPPPYYRPPHWRYGSYYYSPSWGWYFTAGLVGATLVYVATLPGDQTCEEVKSSDETLYVCDGVLYRATYYDDELVYEIVSDDPSETPTPQPDPGAVDVLGLSLTQPMTTGPAVRELQQVLLDSGYDPGSVDGVFGSATETALLWLQYDYWLEQTGMVDRPTAELLGFLPPSEPPPGADPESPPDGGTVTEASEAPAPEAPPETGAEGAEAPAEGAETPESGD